MSFDVRIFHSVEEVGQEAWDHLSGGRPFTSYRWYRFGERVMAYDTPLYVVLFRQGEPVARATLWLTGREYLPIRVKPVRLVLEAMIGCWPLLICHSPLSSTTATSGLTLPGPPLREAALRTIAEVARELLEKNRGSFCLFSYLEEQEAREPGWPDPFVWTKVPDPGTRLDITWPDFEGYLAHLRKKQRYNVRRNMRLASELGIEIKQHPVVRDVDRAMTLHRNVNRRHKSGTVSWMRGALEHAGMVDAVWLTAEVEGRLVGCELMLGDGDAWLVTGLGLDYTTEYAYFVLGYADIRCAIERGARFLRWGSLTYDVKERLGFEAESSDYDVFAGRGKLLQRLGRWVATNST
jgi:predicted N-acyltransferase